MIIDIAAAADVDGAAARNDSKDDDDAVEDCETRDYVETYWKSMMVGRYFVIVVDVEPLLLDAVVVVSVVVVTVENDAIVVSAA